MLQIHTSNLSLLAVRPIAFQCFDQDFKAISCDERVLVQRILPLAHFLIPLQIFTVLLLTIFQSSHTSFIALLLKTLQALIVRQQHRLK